ncbi:hypothetical protein KY314_05025 [Candidatus Woesearchaeota archaeon]|nr:hypothetical protein [Candidatus Woesearchaeota archaeon]
MKRLELELQALAHLEENKYRPSFKTFYCALCDKYGVEQMNSYWVNYQIRTNPGYQGEVPALLRRQAE